MPSLDTDCLLRWLLDDIPAPFSALAPSDEPVVGSALAATASAGDALLVEVQQVGRPTVRAAVTPLDKRSVAVVDAAPLRPVFDRCAPGTPARVAVALEALPKRARLQAVRVFAEWSAWRGAAPAAALDAAAQCLSGDCTALATVLTTEPDSEPAPR